MVFIVIILIIWACSGIYNSRLFWTPLLDEDLRKKQMDGFIMANSKAERQIILRDIAREQKRRNRQKMMEGVKMKCYYEVYIEKRDTQDNPIIDDFMYCGADRAEAEACFNREFENRDENSDGTLTMREYEIPDEIDINDIDAIEVYLAENDDVQCWVMVEDRTV